MDVELLLKLVTTLVPVATELVQALVGVPVSEATGLASTVAKLVGIIESIRTQTVADYPAVWADVHTDWMETLAKWQGLQVSGG